MRAGSGSITTRSKSLGITAPLPCLYSEARRTHTNTVPVLYVSTALSRPLVGPPQKQFWRPMQAPAQDAAEPLNGSSSSPVTIPPLDLVQNQRTRIQTPNDSSPVPALQRGRQLVPPTTQRATVAAAGFTVRSRPESPSSFCQVEQARELPTEVCMRCFASLGVKDGEQKATAGAKRTPESILCRGSTGHRRKEGP